MANDQGLDQDPERLTVWQNSTWRKKNPGYRCHDCGEWHNGWPVMGVPIQGWELLPGYRSLCSGPGGLYTPDRCPRCVAKILRQAGE
jgi:DNA-directed RNA polymerase subunit RPC12/RpoP